jgi:hypothetical protein
VDGVLLARHRVFDQFEVCLDKARNAHGGVAAVRHADLDRREARLAYMWADRGKDLKEGTALLSAHDREQGLTLLGGGPLVDDGVHRAVTFVQGSRPVHCRRGCQAVKLGVAEIALAHLEGDETLAVPLRWSGVEVAGTGGVN